MAEEGSEKPPGHGGWLALRGRREVLGAATGHVAVHVVEGAGGTGLTCG
jgi:hypothetical protein